MQILSLAVKTPNLGYLLSFPHHFNQESIAVHRKENRCAKTFFLLCRPPSSSCL
ncbi:hypothetical protein ES319_A07G198700v1 [Gossypium barbadense]|uniref:Uncharacterized protein n=1 Tax=Gossypium barbadense TaxID=3634 RepID=A0A5J5V5Z1_GOSBA|nr:hypothetical protein ES319_A07G198700v1 [Gossypium barbadense]